MLRMIRRVESSRSGFFAMPRTFTFKMDKEQLAHASAEFYHFYGHALARWAQLEMALYYWFVRTTGMQDAMARAIFYGARGFMARTEMLEGAIEHASILKPTEKSFLKEALKKAKGYSSFRNKVAHGEPRLNVVEAAGTEGEAKLHFTITQGRNTPSETEETISVAQLRTAGDTFHILAQCVRDMLPVSVKNPTAKPPEECLALVLALPTEPSSKSDPTLKASSPPPQGRVHRNKREHRAAQKGRKQVSPPENE